MNIKTTVKSLLCLILLSGFSFQLHASQQYVIDDLNAFLHSGPGTKYRIVGAVKAGNPITILSKVPSQGYLKVSVKNKIAWIDAKLVSRTPGIAFQLEKTQKQLAQAQANSKSSNQNNQLKISQLKQEIDNKESEIEKLKKKNTDSIQQLTEARDKVSELQHTLDNLDQSTKIQWLSYGGAWALVWFIMGIVIPRLQLKKKKQDRWM